MFIFTYSGSAPDPVWHDSHQPDHRSTIFKIWSKVSTLQCTGTLLSICITRRIHYIRYSRKSLSDFWGESLLQTWSCCPSTQYCQSGTQPDPKPPCQVGTDRAQNLKRQPPRETLNGRLEWHGLYGSLHISDSPDSSSTWLVLPTRDSHIETESNTATKQQL